MATIADSFKHQLQRATSSEGRSTQTARRKVSPPDSGDPACLRNLGDATQIVAGNVGDSPMILKLLLQAYQSPLSEDFQSRLDEPLSLPSDRLLLRREDRLIGHVQVSRRVGWFQGQRCALARLQDYVTLPEYHSSSYASPLLEVAESVAVSEGAILGLVRTDQPSWFAERGWSRCRGQGHTRANTLAILSHLDAQQANRRHSTSSIEVRTWRHFQLDSILKLYQQLAPSMWGTLQRSLETWQWLVGRKAHDQILIAVDSSAEETQEGTTEQHDLKGGSKGDLKEPSEDASKGELPSELDPHRQIDIVGYAIVRDSCIVEMLTLPGHSAVRTLLLSQACRDAIDHDHHFVSLHTPAADPMHELLVTAGGSWIADSEASTGQAMLKLLAPDRWIERLYPLLHERAREAGISRPLSVDFAVGKQTLRFTLTRRSSRLEPIAHSTNAMQCHWLALQDLLTNNLTFPEAIAQGRLRTPNLSQLRILAALFPPKLYWQSPFPLLRL